jgi:ATP-dependent Clp protease ATP-binding subunit ClpA
VLNYISHEMSSDDMDGDAGGFAKTGKEGEGKKKKTNPLEAYAVDMMQLAAQDKLDPLIGRQSEMQRTMQVLCRRRKNNPVFVGDPGVGKTAMAEGWSRKSTTATCPTSSPKCRSILWTCPACWPAPSSAATSNSASRG